MKLFRLFTRPFEGPALVHGLFPLPIDERPLRGIGAFGMTVRPTGIEKRKRLLEYLRARLARRSWRQPA